jgi:fatty-acyl-CoA synthase
VALLVGDLLTAAALARPVGVAATLGEREVTFGRLRADANRTANAMAGLGVTTGDVVGWWADPALRTIEGFAAAAALGAPFVSLNPGFGPEEAATALTDLAPRVLVADRAHAEAAAVVCETLASELVVTGGDGGGATARRGSLPGSDLDDCTKRASPEPSAPTHPFGDAHPQIVYLTSGTTGRPKGVVVSHRASWLRSFPGASTFARTLEGDGGILASFGLFHYGGWHFVLEAWHHRCPIHLADRFDGPTLTGVATRRRPSAMYCIPAVWARVLETPQPDDALSSLCRADTGTSATPLALLRELRRRVPRATTSVLYGSSEGGHITTLGHDDLERNPGSVGRVAPPGVLRIAEDGEILYRSETLMSGYWNRPEETAEALAGGWYHTGDLGRLDEEGYLTIVGRCREVIRTGGETVTPGEVEAALTGLPGIAEAAVVGIHDAKWGEVVCAVVVPAGPSAPPDLAAVRDQLARGPAALASHKHPRRVIAVEAIPRTAATGQIQRALLREQIAVTLERSTAPSDT